MTQTLKAVFYAASSFVVDIRITGDTRVRFEQYLWWGKSGGEVRRVEVSSFIREEKLNISSSRTRFCVGTTEVTEALISTDRTVKTMFSVSLKRTNRRFEVLSRYTMQTLLLLIWLSRTVCVTHVVTKDAAGNDNIPPRERHRQIRGGGGGEGGLNAWVIPIHARDRPL